MCALPAKRPSPDQRRLAVLDAAADVFFEQGYAGTSIDAIIERIGGSKRDIYKEFGSKEGLFEALVIYNSDKILMALMADDLSTSDLRSMLIAFGRTLMEMSLTPKMLGVYRSILVESQRFPVLGREFYEKGPGRGAARLCEVLEAACARGEVQIADCAVAADMLIGMFRDNSHLRQMLGLQDQPSAVDIQARVTTAVDIFLNGVRVGRP